VTRKTKPTKRIAAKKKSPSSLIVSLKEDDQHYFSVETTKTLRAIPNMPDLALRGGLDPSSGQEERYLESFRVADPQNSRHRPMDSSSLAEHLPPEIFPKFREEDGKKYLVENSANTGTFVRFGYPPLEYEARYAMEWAQQTREEKNVSVEDIYDKCPIIRTLANRTEVVELARSNPGHPDSGKWAVAVLARALQKPPETISKYARTDPYKKQSLNRKTAPPRRTK
jgi:hypothetical protein